MAARSASAWTSINIPGDWDGWNQADNNRPWKLDKVSPPGTPGGADWFTNVVYIASSGGDTNAGTYAFKMVGDQNWANNWGSGGAVAIDGTTSMAAGGGNSSITVANGNYYSFRTLNPPGGSSATIGVMKTSARPVSVARASQSPTAPRTNDTVTVNITLGASKSSEERIFVRWTTNNFTTSSYVEASGSGTAYSSVIPALPGGVTNKYYVFSTTVASPSDSTIDYLTLNLDSNAGDNYSYTPTAMPWPGGATGGYPSDPASNIHHYKEQAVIGNGYILCMLDLNGSLYDIYFPSVGARYGSGTSNEGYRGPQEFPYCGSLDAQANGQMNVINGMGGIGLSRGGTNSIHWLKNQNGTDYTNTGQKWQSDDVNVVHTTNKLAITSNNILVQQYDFVPSTTALPVITDGTRTNYGVYIKRFLLTNLESTTNTVDFYYDVNFNVKGANVDDAMYWETTVSGTRYNAMIVYDNAARSVTGTGCGPTGYGDSGGSFDASKNYNPTSFGSYDRNASVYFGTVMKLVTNTVNGLGEPADGSWRDHTSSDNQEGWIGKRITLPPGATNEVDVMIVGSWDDASGQTGTHNYWGRPMITWFYTNSMATVQSTTETYWSNWVSGGVTIDFPGTYYDKLWKRQLLVAATHQDAVNGSIIAGSHNGAYPYCWPRDGAYAAITFARSGHTNEALNFIHFLNDHAYRAYDSGIGDKGFFYQKYTTDGYQVWTAAQVDETASVPWAMFYIYSITGDAGFLTNYWNLAYTSGRASSEDSAISPGGLYFDDTYNLMYANNVWEDQNMLTLYGNSAVVRGLYDAANIAGITGNSGWSTTFSNRAANIRDNGMTPRINANVEAADISLLGLVIPYEVYTPTNSVMTNIVEKIHGRQGSAGGSYYDNLVETSSGIAGLLRRYNRKTTNPSELDNYWNGEAWFLASSWYGEYFARWQDYVPGKQMISTNLYILNLLTNMMDNIMIGAEQVAPDGSQKYTGFRLQTSWPNLWEADTTMIDQMAMFLDYKPQATNNTCYFAPKLPVGWDSIAFNNMLFKNQRFNITVAESTQTVGGNTPTNVTATINKLTSGSMNVDIYLRVPGDQATNYNHLVAVNDATNSVGNTVNGCTTSIDTATGRIRVNGPLNSGAGVNTIKVLVETCAAITVSPTSLPTVYSGVAYSQTVSASGGTSPYSFSITAGSLPSGLTLNSSSGLISGTYSGGAGTATFTVTATDASSCTGNRAYTVTLATCPTITVSPSSLPNGTLNVAYSQSLSASGGTSPYTFAVQTGSLPTGLTLSSAGVISGTPSSTGNYTFTVRATATGGCTGDSSSYTVTIGEAPSISAQPQPQSVCSGGTATFSVTASGSSLTYAWRKRDGGWGTGKEWTLNADGGGFFVGTSQNNGDGSGNIDTSSKAWGIYNSSGGTAEAVRNIATLQVGQTFQVDMDNGYIGSGKSVGVGLRNSSNNAVWEFYFNGGGSSYTINAGSVAPTPNVGITYKGVRITFTLTSSTTYSATIQTLGSGGTTNGPFTGTLLSPTGGQSISQVRFWNYDAGSGATYDAFFNSLTAGNYTDGAAAYSTSTWTNGSNLGSAPLSDGGNISGSTTSTLTIYPVSGSDAGTYDVYIYNAYGQVASSSATLTATTVGAASGITGATSVCPNETGVQYSISAVSGALGYNWTVPSGASITDGSGTTQITVTFGSSSGNVSVTPTNGACSGTSTNLAVTVSTNPTTTATSDAPYFGGAYQIVQGETLNLSASTVAGATAYNWTRSGGGYSTNAQNASDIPAPGTYTYTVVVPTSCGTASNSTPSISVLADTEGYGIPDSWKTAHGYSSSKPWSDIVANGMTLLQSYLAGVDPTSANTRLSISNIAVNASGNVTVTWRSQQDGTTPSRLYDLWSYTGPFTNGAVWSRIESNVSAAGSTTALANDASGAGVTQRFYRVTIAGKSNEVMTAEIAGLQRHTLVEGRNYISMALLPGTNTLLSVLGTNQLPQGSSESAATAVDIWDQTNQAFLSNNARYWLDVGTNGWRQHNTTQFSNGVLLDPNKGIIITIRGGQGTQTLRTVGFVSTNQQVQVVQGGAGTVYSVVSSTFPRPVAPADSGLLASGFVGSSTDSPMQSDWLLFLNPATQQFDTKVWYDANGGVWRNVSDASLATQQLQAGQAVLIQRKNRASNFSWTNAVPYTVPLQGP